MSKCNCIPLESCECPIKDLSTDCVIYKGYELPNTDIVTGDDITTVIKKIDDRFTTIEKSTDIMKPKITNVGSGERIYSGEDAQGYSMLRTLKPTGKITLTTTSNSIEIGAEFTPELENKGNGIGIYDGDIGVKTIKGVGGTTVTDTPNGIEIRSEGGDYELQFTEVGTGPHTTILDNEVIVSKALRVDSGVGKFITEISEVTEYIDFKQKTFGVENYEGGIPIIEKVEDSSSINVKSKILVPGENITITEESGKIEISADIPTQDPVISSQNIYVDTNNTLSGEGTKQKPYNTLSSALNKFIGSGTKDSPDLLGSKIIILSDTNHLDPLNINRLHIVIKDDSVLEIVGQNMIDDVGLSPNYSMTISGGYVKCLKLLSTTQEGDINITSKIKCTSLGNVSTIKLKNLDIESEGDNEFAIIGTGQKLQITESNLNIKNAKISVGQAHEVTFIKNNIEILDNINLFDASNLDSSCGVKYLNNIIHGSISSLYKTGTIQGNKVEYYGNTFNGEVLKLVDTDNAEKVINMVFDNNYVPNNVDSALFNDSGNRSQSNFIESNRREYLKSYLNISTALADTTVKNVIYMSKEDDNIDKSKWIRQTKV